MRRTSDDDELMVISAARVAADELLAELRAPIEKAMSVATPHAFDAAVARLAGELRRASSASDVEAMRAAVGVLDIDWRAATAQQRSAVVRAALAAAGRATAAVPTRIEASLGPAATAVVRAARGDARRDQRLAIAADFNAIDHRAIAYLRRANTALVTDAYGRRLEAFGDRARGIVARGLEQGLARDDIAADLASAADRALVSNLRSYWDVVAASFIGEARSFSQMSSYAEAGIERYVISAVLDEVTTDACRFLDGKVLRTADALGTFERLEASDDPLAIKRERPWVRERQSGDGVRELVVTRGSTATTLAAVERSGVGARDDRGAFTRTVDARDLAPAGIGLPPYHGLCRSSTLAS
ncbi:MAG: head morphogenesis protein [Polyangiales bacterium]